MALFCWLQSSFTTTPFSVFAGAFPVQDTRFHVCVCFCVHKSIVLPLSFCTWSGLPTCLSPSKSPSSNKKKPSTASKIGLAGSSNFALPFCLCSSPYLYLQLQSKREMFFKSESNSPSGPPPNPPVLGNLNLANNNVVVSVVVCLLPRAHFFYCCCCSEQSEQSGGARHFFFLSFFLEYVWASASRMLMSPRESSTRDANLMPN